MKSIAQILNQSPVLKNKKVSTALFHCFKKRGIPGNLLKVYYDRYSEEYMVRKYWYMEYKIEQGAIKRPVAWLRNNIENEYSENDGFWTWWRNKREAILRNENLDENIKIITNI